MMQEKEIVPVLRRLSENRNARVFFMRKSVQNLMDNLTDTQQDALVSLALAHRVLSGHLSAKTMRYGDAPGGMQPQDHMPWRIDLERRARSWSADMARNNPLARSVCKRVAEDEESLYAISRSERISWQRALDLLRLGLDAFADA